MRGNKTKILHTIRQGKIGGGETHLVDLVNNLDSNLFESIVLSFTDGEMINKLNQIGIKNYIVQTERPFDIFKWNKVRQIIKKENIDIVHAHGTRACSNSYYFARYYKKPLIYTIHGWSFHSSQSFLIKKLRIATESFLCKKATLNVCVSESNKEDGEKYFNLKNALVIRNGIDLNRFNPNLSLPNIRESLGIPAGHTLVGFIARLTEQKDPFTLLQAWKQVCNVEKTVALLMVGGGELQTEVLKLAEELNILPHIYFQDFRTDVPSILKSIDIYCLPSLWEGLPIGVLEAMAMGKGVIATGVDGTKEIIADSKSGILVPPKSSDKLAEAILLLHRNKKLRETLAENAIDTIERQYDITTMIAEIEKVYKSFIM